MSLELPNLVWAAASIDSTNIKFYAVSGFKNLVQAPEATGKYSIQVENPITQPASIAVVQGNPVAVSSAPDAIAYQGNFWPNSATGKDQTVDKLIRTYSITYATPPVILLAQFDFSVILYALNSNLIGTTDAANTPDV